MTLETCVVCRSSATVGTDRLYCADHQPVGHCDERDEWRACFDAEEPGAVWARFEVNVQQFQEAMQRVCEVMRA